MPYMVEGKCVYKKNPDGSKGKSMGCSETEEKAKAHMRALYAHTNDSLIQEMSLFVSRASFETNEPDPNKRMRFRLSSSDIGKDLSDERMSLELFNNFKRRIDEEDVPEIFKSVICEETWCGGMPYLSVAHYKSGVKSKNVPGVIDDVFVDGNVFKSKGYCYENPMGRATWNSLVDDQQKRKSGVEDFEPVRVSIGFLDLKHKHAPDGGQEYIFERKSLGEICALCEKGIGDKIYLDGVLVHEALTRVPMNPRTNAEVDLEQKSMDDIVTRKDDARSIVGDLADTLDQEEVKEKSMLVIKSDGTPAPSTNPFTTCYNPNDNSFNQDCINATMDKFMAEIRDNMHTVKSNISITDDVVNDVIVNYLKTISPRTVAEEKSMEPKIEVVEKKVEDEKKEVKDNKAEEKKEEKSVLDTTFESLKSVLAGKPTAEQVQNAFNALGVEVEKSYTPAPAETSAELVAVIKQLSTAVQAIQLDIATLKAGTANVQKTIAPVVPQSRSLFVQRNPLEQGGAGQVGEHGRPIVNGKEMSQLEYIAKKSTGAIA